MMIFGYADYGYGYYVITGSISEKKLKRLGYTYFTRNLRNNLRTLR